MFLLASPASSIVVPARLMKGKENHTVKLSGETVTFLGDLKGRPANLTVWPGKWATSKKATEFV